MIAGERVGLGMGQFEFRSLNPGKRRRAELKLKRTPDFKVQTIILKHLIFVTVPVFSCCIGSLYRILTLR